MTTRESLKAELQEKLGALSKEELQAEMVLGLSFFLWEDISGAEGTDPEAAQTLAVAGADFLYLLSRYADEGKTYALVALKLSGEVSTKTVTSDQTLLEWLWGKVAPAA